MLFCILVCCPDWFRLCLIVAVAQVADSGHLNQLVFNLRQVVLGCASCFIISLFCRPDFCWFCFFKVDSICFSSFESISACSVMNSSVV